jgi:hypothetical protein
MSGGKQCDLRLLSNRFLFSFYANLENDVTTKSGGSMKKIILLIAIVSIAAVIALPKASYATDTEYTNQSAWLAAAPGDDDQFGPGETIGDLAVTSTVGAFGAPRGVFSGEYTDVWLDRPTNGGGETTVFSDGDGDASTPFYAFGGFWDFSPGGYGDGLTVTLNNGDSFEICGEDYGPATCQVLTDGEFFGVVTSTPFTTLTISDGNQYQVAETYDLADLGMVHTPEPSSLSLLGLGLASLVGVIRRKCRS